MAAIRIGIIGTGGMAGQHAHWFGRQKGVRLAACLDVDRSRAEAYAAKHGVARVAASLDELLEGVDAVSVVTPDRFHASYSLAVLTAGKHLFCEKPLTVTMAEARRVARSFAIARRSGVVGKVNFSHRGRHSDRAAALIASGAIGEPRHVRAHYLQGWLADPETLVHPARVWRLQTALGSGGVLGDLGCHILDFTSAVAGPIARLRCSLRTLPKHDAAGRVVGRVGGMALDANDTADCELEFANGAFGVLHTTRWATGCRNDVELVVHGTEGAVALGHQAPDRPWLRVLNRRGRQAGEWREISLPGWDDPWRRFTRAIRQGGEVQPDITRGAEIQALLEACVRSQASGRFERPPKHL